MTGRMKGDARTACLQVFPECQGLYNRIFQSRLQKNIVEAPDRSILTKVAGKIVDRGLSVPAVFALELMQLVHR